MSSNGESLKGLSVTSAVCHLVVLEFQTTSKSWFPPLFCLFFKAGCFMKLSKFFFLFFAWLLHLIIDSWFDISRLGYSLCFSIGFPILHARLRNMSLRVCKTTLRRALNTLRWWHHWCRTVICQNSGGVAYVLRRFGLLTKGWHRNCLTSDHLVASWKMHFFQSLNTLYITTLFGLEVLSAQRRVKLL